MAGPQHRTPEYRAARRAIDQAQARGEVLVCVQPVCLHTTRLIPPNAHADVAHNDDGTVIIGPAHRRCNRSDGATKRTRPQHRRWIL